MAILESGLLPLGRIYLERRPSSPGLDHGLCVYSKLGNLAAVGSLLFETAETAFCSSHTKKMSTVFASFSRCSHRFSPAWTTRARLKGYTHTSTLGHMTTPLYAAHQRGTSSLKTAVLSQHSSPMLLKSRCWQVLRQRICYPVGSEMHQIDDMIFDELVDDIAHAYQCHGVAPRFGYSDSPSR